MLFNHVITVLEMQIHVWNCIAPVLITWMSTVRNVQSELQIVNPLYYVILSKGDEGDYGKNWPIHQISN